jgi:hypothetical protein
MIFGQPNAENDSPEANGKDMVRIIDPLHLDNLRPASRKAIATFHPVVQDELKSAVDWFFLATAARLARGEKHAHSSMLVHTFINTSVHERFREPLEEYRKGVLARIVAGDPSTLEELRLQWLNESSRVPAETYSRVSLEFDVVREHLPEVIERTRIVLDNSRSKDRLDYAATTEPQFVIAVGANTLSRGLTLEGLISSVFVRTARAYDTLLQMGRWFGFRNGYEELPRIWMTAGLEQDFRHLAQVEAEMRRDIDLYQEQNRTPMDVAVRILRHPSMAITAKMGAAETANISFAGQTLTTRYFRAGDAAWLHTNLEAARTLADNVASHGQKAKVVGGQGDSQVYNDVPVADVVTFLENYQVHEAQPNMDPKLLIDFIQDSMKIDNVDPVYLSRWTVVFIAGSGETVRLGALGDVATSKRSAEENAPDKTRIHTLTSPTDFGLGLGKSRTELREACSEGEASNGEPKTASDPRMLTLRSIDSDNCRKGILIVNRPGPVGDLV